MKKIGKTLQSNIIFLVALYALCCVGWNTVGFAQEVTVRATVNNNEIEVGDTVDYTITVSAKDMVANVGEPRLPDLEGFKLVGRRPEVIAQNFIINGQIQALTTQNFHYFLEAEKKGRFKIEAAEVTVQGKAYSTSPIQINVVAADATRRKKTKSKEADDPFSDPFFDEEDQIFSQLLQRQRMMDPRRRQRAEDEPGRGGGVAHPSRPINAQEAFTIDVEVDKKEAYAGEQITVSYYLYSKHLIRDIDPLKYPDLKAFWKEDIEVPQRLDFEDVVVNGVQFKRALLASYAIFPIKPGVALIDPYKAKCSVMALQNGGGFYGLSPSATFTKSSPELRLNVKALPTQSVPRSFSGAVGEFKVQSSVPAQKLQLGQPFSFKIRIEGRGNAKMIDLPPLDLPNTLEQYDSKSESKFFKDGRSYKDFELLLIPRQAGPLTIPAVKIAVFDPVQKRYVEHESDPITVTITGGAPGESVSNRPMDSKSGVMSAPTASTLPLPASDWSSDFVITRESRNLLWCLMFVFSLIILVWRSWVELGWGQPKQNLKKLVNKRLVILRKEAERGDFRSVGAKAVNLISFALGEVAGEEGGHSNLEKMLTEVPPSVRRELEATLKDLQSAFEAMSFAPVETLGTLKDKSVLREKINGLEKVLSRAITLSGVDSSDERADKEPATT